eukprot:scaffold2892_cov118-Skeletonema_menzelii.AAC.6
MKWSSLFRPSSSSKQSKKQSSKGIDKTNILPTNNTNESRQDDNDKVPTAAAAAPKPKQPMLSLAYHHVSTNHLCGIKVAQCCNRTVYDAAKK